jgi:hypothetical protein
MLRSRIIYVMTWIALGVLLTAGLGLMVASWNGAVTHSPTPVLMVLLWLCLLAAGIFLFMLAVKKAHRLWIQEEREHKLKEAETQATDSAPKGPSRDNQLLDFAATARKLVRRIPEASTLEESGRELLKNLARELEIMSGILYVRKRSTFEPISTYALASPSGIHSFSEGEGLPGQVARNQQIMLLTRLPEGHLKVCSGLGKSEPAYLAIVPFVHKGKTIAVLECSGYRYEPHDIESMFRIFARELMEKLSPNLK